MCSKKFENIFDDCGECNAENRDARSAFGASEKLTFKEHCNRKFRKRGMYADRKENVSRSKKQLFIPLFEQNLSLSPAHL